MDRPNITTVELSQASLPPLTEMMLEFWTECNFHEELQNCQKIFDSGTDTAFLALEQDRYIGFIQLSLRYHFVEGTNSSPVAYIEGLYVRPGYRKQGIAEQLVRVGEKWGREKSCSEMGSDTDLWNEVSITFHQKMGFEDVGRIVCFRKDL